MNIRFYLLSVSVLAMLSACTAGAPDEASAPVASAASSKKVLSPEEAHKLARERVEPSEIVQHNEYVKTVAQMEAEREQRAREAIEQVEQARARAEAKKTENQRVAVLEDGVDAVKTQFKGIKDMFSEVKVTPATETATAPKVATRDAQASSAQSITSSSIARVRTGEYPTKSRLVLDINGAAEFRYELDNANNLLIVRLPNSAWDAPSERVFNGSKALQAYAAKPAQNGGTLLAVKLNGPSKILASEALGKNDAGYNRIFIDVAKL